MSLSYSLSTNQLTGFYIRDISRLRVNHVRKDLFIQSLKKTFLEREQNKKPQTLATAPLQKLPKILL